MLVGKSRLDPIFSPELNPQEAADQLFSAMNQTMTLELTLLQAVN